MTERTPPHVAVDTPIAEDVDLDREDIRLADATRLTESAAGQIVDQARRAAGRPSLSGRATVSPQIAFRIAPDVRRRAAELAAHEGKTLSQLAREAFEDRVAATQ